MKIKYNFGLLKNQTIGFIDSKTGLGIYGTLKNVIRKWGNYRFIYEDNYIEISETIFSSCLFMQTGEIYYFMPDNCISGLMVFTMYDTFGFPPELTQEIFEEKGFSVDMNGFSLIKEIPKKTQETFKTQCILKGALLWNVMR